LGASRLGVLAPHLLESKPEDNGSHHDRDDSNREIDDGLRITEQRVVSSPDCQVDAKNPPPLAAFE